MTLILNTQDALAELFQRLDTCQRLDVKPTWPENDGPTTVAAMRSDYARRRPEGHWFDRDSMRFFGTRFVDAGLTDVHQFRCSFFLTSEKSPFEPDRKTSLRCYQWASADVCTVGPFNEMTAHHAKKFRDLIVADLRARPVLQVTWCKGTEAGEHLTRNPHTAETFAEFKRVYGADVDPVRPLGAPIKPTRMWVQELESFDPLYGAFAIWGQYPNGDQDLIAHRQTRAEADAYVKGSAS